MLLSISNPSALFQHSIVTPLWTIKMIRHTVKLIGLLLKTGYSTTLSHNLSIITAGTSGQSSFESSTYSHSSRLKRSSKKFCLGSQRWDQSHLWLSQTAWPTSFFRAPLQPLWLFRGSPMLMDPHSIKQHADLHRAVRQLQQEVARP